MSDEQVLIIHLGGCNTDSSGPPTYSITALEEREPIHVVRNLGDACEIMHDAYLTADIAKILRLVSREINDAAGQEIARQYGEENRQ